MKSKKYKYCMTPSFETTRKAHSPKNGWKILHGVKNSMAHRIYARYWLWCLQYKQNNVDPFREDKPSMVWMILSTHLPLYLLNIYFHALWYPYLQILTFVSIKNCTASGESFYGQLRRFHVLQLQHCECPLNSHFNLVHR